MREQQIKISPFSSFNSEYFHYIHQRKLFDVLSKIIASCLLVFFPFTNPISAGIIAAVSYYVTFKTLTTYEEKIYQKIGPNQYLLKPFYKKSNGDDIKEEKQTAEFYMYQFINVDENTGELGSTIGAFLGAVLATYFKSDPITASLSTSALSFFGGRIAWAGLKATKYVHVDVKPTLPIPVL